MFCAALTSASKIDPQLVQTKRDRLMRLAASTVPQALQQFLHLVERRQAVADCSALVPASFGRGRGYRSADSTRSFAGPERK
jgi:hypothetical protein